MTAPILTIDAADALRRSERAPLVDNLLVRIEADLAGGKYEPGAFMGTRRDLCEAYDTSPAIFFQAARILEARGLAMVKPGSGGGLFAGGSTLDSCARRLGTYLEFTGIDFEDVGPVSIMFQGMCVREACANISAGHADRIQSTLRRLLAPKDVYDRNRLFGQLFIDFAETSGNPVLVLVFRVVFSVMMDVVSIARHESFDEVPHVVVQEVAVKLAEAVMAGDPDATAAAYLSFRHGVDRRHAAHDRRRPVMPVDPLPPFDPDEGRSGTLSARLARYILNEIRHGRWAPGRNLGREPELLARYGVSRATFRQAVRLLQDYSAVEMRRGPKGGLLIASPSADALMWQAVVQVELRCPSAADARQVLAALVCLAYDLVQAREQEPPHAEGLRPRDEGSLAQLVHGLIARSGNRTIALLVALVAIIQQRVEPPGELADGEACATLLASYAGEARAGNGQRARGLLNELVRTFGVPPVVIAAT